MKKVLIICAGLQFGGVERFSANISLYAPKEEFAFDYLIFEGLGDAYVPEIEQNGSRVITIPSPSLSYKKYIESLGDLIKENQYDVIHSQTQFNSGINMLVAKKKGVPVRISHSHTTAHEHSVPLRQTIYECLMRHFIKKNSTVLCACGVDAGKWMYGKKPFTVINNGINTKAFEFSEENRRKVRMQYGISEDTFVIGHSGTLSKLKNQEFLIRLLPEIMRKKPEIKLICLGTGDAEFKEYLMNTACEMNVADSVIFPGAVMNVNEYLSAFDVFAFPSLREGTPIALIEAQANGLPCIISDTIPKDAVITDTVNSVSLENKSLWIDNLSGTVRNNSAAYCEEVKSLGYDIKTSFDKLYALYRGKDDKDSVLY